MSPAPSAPLPGSMTVPPWYGWEALLVPLAVVLVVAAVALLLGSSRAGAERRTEWEAWLGARSRRAGLDVPEPGPAGTPAAEGASEPCSPTSRPVRLGAGGPAGGSAPSAGDEVGDLRGRHRTADVETLCPVAPVPGQRLQGGLVLDALGDEHEAE
jgi:hypothetical protein